MVKALNKVKAMGLIKLVMLGLMFLMACQESNEHFDWKREELVAAINQARTHRDKAVIELKQTQADLERLKHDVDKMKISSDKAVGFLVLDIRQSSFTLDIGEHFKNKMNAMQLKIAVHPTLWDSVKVGDVLGEKFKSGSYWFDGDIAHMKVTVLEKGVIEQPTTS